MHELMPRPNAVCSVLSNVSRSAPGMRAVSAWAPRYGVAGSPVVPITRIGAVPRTRTSPSLSPLAGFGMPTHDAVANEPPHGGLCDWNVATSASSAALVGVDFDGRSTHVITELASTSGSQ